MACFSHTCATYRHVTQEKERPGHCRAQPTATPGTTLQRIPCRLTRIARCSAQAQNYYRCTHAQPCAHEGYFWRYANAEVSNPKSAAYALENPAAIQNQLPTLWRTRPCRHQVSAKSRCQNTQQTRKYITAAFTLGRRAW